MLYEQEHSVGFNPRPDTARRQRQAAEKAIEIDGACSDGWRAMATAAFFFDRDLTALRLAADRVATLNRLDVHVLADVGRLLAYAGDWQRGLELVRLGMALNPHHQGWYHFPTLFFHYARHEYEAALSAAKRINMPAYFGTHVNTMVAAAQLGRRDEVEACLRSLERTGREYLDVAVARQYWKTWLWDTGSCRSPGRRIPESQSPRRAAGAPGRHDEVRLSRRRDVQPRGWIRRLPAPTHRSP